MKMEERSIILKILISIAILPVINVSWNDARDFADRMGCRLTTVTFQTRVTATVS